MLDRQWLLTFQRGRDDSDRHWMEQRATLERQWREQSAKEERDWRKKDARWRLIELVVMGVIVIAISVAAQVVKAFLAS